MKNKNIAIALSSVLALIAAVATTAPVFAHTDKYWIGYSQGKTQARTDYYAYANDYRPWCPVYDAWTAAHGPHSSNFCAGFEDGYKAMWHSIVVWHNARVALGSSSVYQPTCKLLCAIVKVN